MKPIYTALLSVCLIGVLAGCAPKPSPVSPAQTPNAQTPSAGASPAPATALTGTLNVGVPCGLAMVYKEIRTLFLQQNPGVRFMDKIEDIRPLRDGIKDGTLSLDVLISFGVTELEGLEAAGKLAGEPTAFMRRDMDLCVTKGNPLGLKSFQDVARPEVRKIVVCTDDLTIGRATVKALKSAGIWDKLNQGDKIVRLDQPLKAKQWVIGGKADAAFIYRAGETCSVEHPERCVGDKADIIPVPESAHGGMIGIAAVLTAARDPALATKFAQFTVSPQVQTAITEMGYHPAK